MSTPIGTRRFIAPTQLKPGLKDYVLYFLRRGIHGIGWLVLWTFWLALAILLYAQARIATSDEIAIPASVLRNVEQRLAAQGLKLTFGSIHCDTAGNVVMRDVSLFTSAFEDPIVTVRAARCTVNPYGLIFHRIMPQAMRIDGGSLRLPAMFSPDGANSPVIADIAANVELQGDTLLIKGLTARLENLTLLYSGAVTLPRSGRGEKTDTQILAEGIAEYLKIARQVAALAPQLRALERPVLDVTLTPDAKHMALARVTLMADSLRVTDAKEAVTVASGPLRASTSFDFGTVAGVFSSRQGEQDAPPALPLRINATSETLQLAQTARARDARLSLTLPLAEAQQLLQRGAQTPAFGVNLRMASDSLTIIAHDIIARALTASISGQYPKNLRVAATGEVFATPVALETTANLDDKSATLAISTQITPRHIAEISRIAKIDLGAILKPARPLDVDAVAHFAPNWSLTSANGDVEIGPILAYGVPVDRARGTFVYDATAPAARTITFSPALAVVSDSEARGSFTTNLDTLDFRFLLKGTLRPPVITPWLGRWWADFWKDFAFTGPAPLGDVDVQGNWKPGGGTQVFIGVDATRLAYNKVAFDRARLTLFAKPDFIDAIRLFASKGDGSARGNFTYDTRGRTVTTTLNFTANNIDPVTIAPAISPEVADGLTELKFDKPLSRIRAAGRISHGLAAPEWYHTRLDIDAEGDGGFSYAQIPLTGLSARITVRDDDVVFENLDTQIAGGRVNVKAQVYAPPGSRRLGFALTASQVNLGKAIGIARAYATRGAAKATDTGDNALEKQLADAQLDLRMTADGPLDNWLGFQGVGAAEVAGGNLLSINVLGALSRSLSSVPGLNFSTISLNAGQATFSLDGAKLTVPDAVLTGSRAVIKLNGDLALDTRYTNITARVYPLSATRNIIGRGLGVLLVPFSHLTELKFSGPIESPKWRFSYGPTSLFRALTGRSSGQDQNTENTVAPAPELAPAPEPLPIFGQPQPLLPFGGGAK